jgi:AcrR family transcriptional regulator
VIAGAAMRLFLDRGFDRVSVAEKTVYSYFPLKAELFFDEGDDLLAGLLAAVRYRVPGEPALEAVRRFVAAVALVAVLRASFEAPYGNATPLRDEAARALSLLATGVGGYAVAGHAHDGPTMAR